MCAHLQRWVASEQVVADGVHRRALALRQRRHNACVHVRINV